MKLGICIQSKRLIKTAGHDIAKEAENGFKHQLTNNKIIS